MSCCRRLFLVLVCVLLAAPPGLLAAAPARQEPLTIRVGGTPAAIMVGLYAAHTRGYFRDEGLDVEVLPIDQPNNAVTALGIGQLEIAALGTGAGIYNMMARGLPVAIIAGVLRQPLEGEVGLVVRKSLIDEGRVRDYADLRGLRIGVVSLTSSAGSQLARALRLGGLTVDDVDVRELPHPSLLAALTNGALDAAIMVVPYVAQAQQSGVGVLWRRTGDYALGAQIQTWVANTDFARRQPAVLPRFLYAYLRGTREYVAASQADADLTPYHRILASYIPVPDPAVFAAQGPVLGLDIDGAINRASLEEDQDIFLAMGALAQRVDLDRAIDEQYLRAALARLDGPR